MCSECNRMSPSGYKQKSKSTPRHDRFSSDSRHSNADVRFPADFVCFASSFGRGRDPGWTSAYDPKPPFAVPHADQNKRQF